MRFIELDLRAGTVFALVGVLIRTGIFGEFELFKTVHAYRIGKKYLHIKYSMGDYRKEDTCGKLVFKTEDWRIMPGRGALRFIHMYACLPTPSWYNEVPVRVAGRGAVVKVESMNLSPTLGVDFYAAMWNRVQENGTFGFLV